MSNKIVTENLAQLAEQIVDAKLLMGAIKGRTGWDDGNPEATQHLENSVQNAIWNRDWADIVTYATMLAAIDFNKSQETDNASSDGS